MKITIKTIGGSTHTGTSFTDLLQQMKLSAHVPSGTPEKYMQDVQRRSEVYSGERIEYGTVQEFFEELVRIGIVERMVISAD